MIGEIKKLIEGRNQLAAQALEVYKPLVAEIIDSKTKDVNKICLTLDYMLGFCFDDKMLLLYRRLCSYLYNIDKEAMASYVEAFREMWDEEGKMFGKNKIT